MRLLAWSCGLLLVVLLLALLVVGWTFSDRILVPQPYGLQPEFRILAVAEATVTLPPPEEGVQFARTDARGEYGLRYEGGVGRLGPILERRSDDGAVVRRFRHQAGERPRAGDAARLDVTVFRGDPGRAHGFAFQDVTVEAPVGPVPAWWLDAGGPRAVLMLHGRRRARRTEALRSLPLYREAGWSVLVGSYRNHDDAPASPDGLYTYGYGEARDALAALRFLAQRGVREVVLVGFSMGASVALEAWERRPDEAPEVVGMVLEAPLVDPRPVVREAARNAGLPLPVPLAELALGVGRLRTGVPWHWLDQRELAPRLSPPVLVIAGTADETVPIGTIDEFVARLPGPERYARLEGVDHMEAWNEDPARYARIVRGFLADLESTSAGP